jgi:hypothetical protein
MAFSFPNVAADSAEIALAWEKVRIAFIVTVDAVGLTVSKARAAVAAAAAADVQTPYRAANYCLQNDVNVDEAVKWLDKSIGIKATYGNLGARARYLARRATPRRHRRRRQASRPARPPIRRWTPHRSRSQRSGRPSSDFRSEARCRPAWTCSRGSRLGKTSNHQVPAARASNGAQLAGGGGRAQRGEQ